MDIFWFDEEIEYEGAQKFDKDRLLASDASATTDPIILYKPSGPCDFAGYECKKQWIEVYPEHRFLKYDTPSWNKVTLGTRTGIISGFDFDVALKLVKATTIRYMNMPRGAEGASVLFINGPNLNLLGKREPELYGGYTLERIAQLMRTRHPKLNAQIMQSNSEGDLVDTIQNASEQFDAIIINAGAYTHTSVAIHDALRTYDDIIIEAHITNPHQREDFRHISFVSPTSDATIAGFGARVYELALIGVMSKL